MSDNNEPRRRVSALKPHDLKGFEKALHLIEANVDDYKKHGLSANNIWFGMVNIIFSAFLLGRAPQYYWVFTTFKGTAYMSLAYTVKSAKNQMLYFLDFCWLFAFVIITSGYVAIIDSVGLLGAYSGILANRVAFLGYFGCATTLGLAVVLLGNAMVLHDAEHMSSLFIHISHPLLAWSFRWHSEEIMSTFPGVFGLFTEEEAVAVGIGELFKPFSVIYMSWWIPYLVWLVVWGRFHRLETTGRESVFIVTVKDFATPLRRLLGVTKDDASISTVRAAVLYMVLHAALMHASVLLSYGAWHSWYFHTTLCLIALLSSSRKGATRYFKMMTRFHQKNLQDFLKPKET